MKWIASVSLCLFFSSFLWGALSREETQQVNDMLNRLSMRDLQDIVVYLDAESRSSSNYRSRELLFLAQHLLREKSSYLFASPTENSLLEILNEQERRLYRTQHIAAVLEQIMQREVFLNEKGEIVLSNGTPLVWENETKIFDLAPYRTPDTPSTLQSSSALAVFEKSIEHPNYSSLEWDSMGREYTLYLVEYNKTFRLGDLGDLNDDEVIVLFGKLFPISLEKPAWAWRSFGLTSIKRQIQTLFEKENLTHFDFPKN
jgi:hypothetical protein